MLIFLKLGGSLITNKSRIHSARLQTISRVLAEVKQALALNPNLQLLIGHGSGSFGHVPAKEYSTRSGVYSPIDWKGFAKVFYEARSLNKVIMREMSSAGIEFHCFPPSVFLTTNARNVELFRIDAVYKAFQNRDVALFYGDVVFDQVLHGSILSTEDLFNWLAPILRPERILLAGQDEGVFEDFPSNKKIISLISKTQPLNNAISSSLQTDVTGGMVEKVKIMQEIVLKVPGISVSIFSGDKNGNVFKALCGENIGTLII